MTVEDFGKALLRRRTLRRWSRAQLQERSGVSESSISNYEVGKEGRFQQPGRYTVIDLASAFGDWDIDEALALVGEEPLSEEERAKLVKPAPGEEGVALGDLAPYWDLLDEEVRQALLTLAASSARGKPRPTHTEILGNSTS